MFSGMTVKTKFERPVVKPKPPEEPTQAPVQDAGTDQPANKYHQSQLDTSQEQGEHSTEPNGGLEQTGQEEPQPKFSFIGKTKLRNKENSDSFKSDLETKEPEEEAQTEKPKFSFMNKSKSNVAPEESPHDETQSQENTERQEETPKRPAFGFLLKKKNQPAPEENQDSEMLHDSGHSSAKIQRGDNHTHREDGSGHDDPSEKTPKPKFAFLSKLGSQTAKKKQELDNSAERINDQENTISLSPVENKADQSFEKPYNGSDDIVESLISSKSTQSKGNSEELSKLPPRKHFVIGLLRRM
jgi:hypothetical protein